MHVAICGAGVIGAACAYYLSRRGVGVTVIERVAVASAASGKSGGFLALDWCDGTPQSTLARRSFALHRELATSLGEDYGYRGVTTRMVLSSERRDVSGFATLSAPHWLDGECAVARELGTPRDTAALDPARFTHALMRRAEANGAALVTGRVQAIRREPSGAVVVIVDGQAVHADRAIVAMGPWTDTLSPALGLPAVAGLKGYSVVLEPRAPVPAESLFVEYEADDGSDPSPEVVARADGSVYVCGIGDRQPVPEDPADVAVDAAACRELARIAGRLSSRLEGAAVLRRQACYRPICADAMPIIGPCPALDGVIVASGHNCWGMLNAPATGLAVSELVCDGEPRTVNLRPFDPRRLAGA